MDPARAAPPVREPRQHTAKSADQRLAHLEATVQTLADALHALTGLEDVPTEEATPERGARAARLAHEILLTAPGISRS